MRVLLVTPRLDPFTGTSPMGEACSALPKALQARGHDLVILCPLYGFIDPTKNNLARRLRTVELPGEEPTTAFTVYDARTPAGVDLLFLGHETLFAPCTEPPTSDDAQNVARYGAFARAVVEVVRGDEPGFDVVHCHGWETALVPALLSEAGLQVGTVLTVDGAGQVGAFDAASYGVTDAKSFLESGVKTAGAVAAVTASLVTELREDAGGLEETFRSRGNSFSAVPPGIDVAVFNPATDAHLPTRYDPMDVAGKLQCKATLQEKLDLPIRADVPLVAVIGRFDVSSGLNSVARIAARLMRNDLQLVAVAESADDDAWSVLDEHRSRWPDRIAMIRDADAGELHRALAAADLALLPPNAPVGSSLHLAALRYGALPIGLRSGTLGDAVVDCDAQLETGTGFLFDDASDDAILAALQRAVAAFGMERAFARCRSRVMRIDVGWERGAYLYERIYESVGKTASLSLT